MIARILRLVNVYGCRTIGLQQLLRAASEDDRRGLHAGIPGTRDTMGLDAGAAEVEVGDLGLWPEGEGPDLLEHLLRAVDRTVGGIDVELVRQRRSELLLHHVFADARDHPFQGLHHLPHQQVLEGLVGRGAVRSFFREVLEGPVVHVGDGLDAMVPAVEAGGVLQRGATDEHTGELRPDRKVRAHELSIEFMEI